MKVKRIFAIVMSVMLTFTMLPYFSAGDFRADAATSLQDKLVQEALDSNYVGK